MTDEHAAFRRAIVESPRDLLARLVYADYLEETGDPNHVARAHLIRTQIALDDPTTDADEDEDDRLKAFEARLMDMFRDEWDQEIPYWLLDEGTVEYRNGFVEHARLSITSFLRNAAELFAAVPLRSLQLLLPAPRPDAYRGAFDRLPALAHIEVLKLGPNATDLAVFVTDREVTEPPLFTELMTCRTLSGLRTLDLAGNRITDAWMVAFVSALPSAAFASSLEVLDLSDSYHLTDAGGNALATARSLFRLKRLVLKDTPFRAATRSMLRRTFGDRVSF